MKYPFVRTAVAAAVLSTFSAFAQAEMSVEERLKAMESRMNALETENQALKGQLKSTEQKVEATSAQVDKVASSVPSSSKAAWAENTRIGGYGELHYNNLEDQHGTSDKNEIDFHRFVLFFGHDFSPKTRFFSELEVEHAVVEGGKGAVELEQAYVEHDINDTLTARGGLFLLPIGILNETHEPPTFYGVERNPVEGNIIPTTWWEGGAGLTARLGGGFTLDGAIHSGLATEAASNYAVRSGRLQVAEAKAKDPAYTARLKWTGIPGLEVAASLQYQSDITQSADNTAGSAWLGETHVVLNRGPFTLKALYAQWNLQGSGPESVGANKQKGWYIEPSYKLTEKLGMFARYNRWDNQAGDNLDSEYNQWNIGMNYWIHPDVVVKLDYQQQSTPSTADELNGFNVGIGYQF
jgi:hypothetical protein